MVDQSHVIGVITQRLGHQLAQAQDAAERDQILKNALNSEPLARTLNQIDGNRLREKEADLRHNPEFMDLVHISEEGETLYRRLYEAGFKEAPEKIHERRQDHSSETPASPLEPNLDG